MTQVVCMMKAANADLQEVVTVRASLHFLIPRDALTEPSIYDQEMPIEALDWDMSLHSPSGTTLVRGRKLGSRSAAVRRPSGFPFVHKPSRSS